MSDVDAGFLALATDVESNFTGYKSGTHAARLATTAYDGLLYHETDTGLLYVGTGSAWIGIEQLASKGAASGYCDLDSSAHVPLARLSGITDAQLASPNNATKRLVFQASATLSAFNTAGDYYFTGDGHTLASGTAGAIGPVIWAGDTNGDYDVPGKTTYIVLRMTVVTNGSASGITYQGHLYQINGVISGSGTVGVGLTLPAFMSTPSETPGAATASVVESGAVVMPTSATNPFVLGCFVTPSEPTNAAVAVTLQVLAYNA